MKHLARPLFALCLIAMFALTPSVGRAFDETSTGFSDVRIPLTVDGTTYVLLLGYESGSKGPDPQAMVLVRRGSEGLERVLPSDPAFAKVFAVFEGMGKSFRKAAEARSAASEEGESQILGQGVDETESGPSMDGLEGSQEPETDGALVLPDGQPIKLGSREIAVAHFVHQSDKDPNMRAVVLFVRSESRPNQLKSQQLQMTMRTLALKPDMYLKPGNHSVSGSVRTLKFEMKKAEDEEEIWLVKGIYQVTP